MEPIRHVSRPLLLAGIIAVALGIIAACSTSGSPTSPTITNKVATEVITGHEHAAGDNPGQDDKGYIDGWFEGETVQLYYTKSYRCEEPPVSGASTNCELGAPPEVDPRGGPIPIIYAIAAAGISPDLTTLACRPGTVCMNHPMMIDASRVGGQPNGPGVPHSHIISEHRGGWFNTVNIRVRSLAAWNQIAQAKTLAKVRQLQNDPDVGGQNLISQDTPTNIFFFISSFQK